MTAAAPKIGFVSLGCPKATVDSERILTQLRAEGYGLAPMDGGADLVVVRRIDETKLPDCAGFSSASEARKGAHSPAM
jgi:hypothetical protein